MGCRPNECTAATVHRPYVPPVTPARPLSLALALLTLTCSTIQTGSPPPLQPASEQPITVQPDSTTEAQAAPPPNPDSPWRLLQGTTVKARYQGRDSLRSTRAIEVLESIGPLPGLNRSDLRATLTVAPTHAVWDSLLGGNVPEWTGGVAIAGRMEIIIPGGWRPIPVQEERRILGHEWAHLALAHEMGGLRIPRWFNEGYAEWAAGGWTDGGARKLALAFIFGRAPPLDSISLRWPRQSDSAHIAYLISASVVEYLVHSSGVIGLERFLTEWQRQASFDNAMLTVYGATFSQLESDWRKWAKKRYGWPMVLSQSLVFWAVLAVVLAGMVLIRRRHNRAQMAKLAAKEPPDAPAYWDAYWE